MNPIGLSILIPVYNRDVRQLTQTLVKQCQISGLNFEVLCYDDASLPEFRDINHNIGDLSRVNYCELPYNHGRSKIRNRLALDAHFPWLLFLDCDSTVHNELYIDTYLKTIASLEKSSNAKVAYGGTSYQDQQPSKGSEIHWYYGSKVEAERAESRMLHPYESFKTNNFIIAKSIFNSIKFDESIVTYGYEDVLFAMELQQHHIQIFHIDNTVIHDGIEPNDVYLEKIKQSIVNLKKLKTEGRVISTRLSRMAEKFKAFPYFIKLSRRWRKACLILSEKTLMKFPKAIFLLQVWKLLYYLEEDKN